VTRPQRQEQRPGRDEPDQRALGAEIADLSSRISALRQAATLPGVQLETLLDAVFAELDGAVHALDQASNQLALHGQDRSSSGLHSERRLLHAAFSATPAPLFIVDLDATVLRANLAACKLLGVGPGYATGRSLNALIEPAARAALRSQLAAVGRTAKSASICCGMLAAAGSVPGELTISPLTVRGDANRLLVSVAAASPPLRPARPGPAAREAASSVTPAAGADAVVAATRRLDLLAAASRLLLESTAVSDSVLLQRCARLLSGNRATWVIIDMRRRGQLRRHFVAGPEDPESVRLAHSAATVDPGPGTVPDQVAESGKSLLISHADDDMILGSDGGGTPLLPLLGAVSVLSVPLADEDHAYGVLTMANRASDSQFGLADAALAEDVGGLLALSISARRTLRRRTEAAEALQASLLPPVLKPVPGLDIASAHMAPTRGREVGGDFYDVYPTPGGWGVAIGDVCGKGEDAAAATAAARHAIRVLAHWNADPAEVLRGTNEIMLTEQFGGRFVTACAAHLSWQHDKLRIVLASAGHPGPVLLRPDGRAQLTPGGGVPLGIFPDPEPSTLDVELMPGDSLFFFTDGLSDARSRDANYLEDSLTDRLAVLAGRNAAEILSEMRKVILDFTGGRLLDDLTMLALRVDVPPAQ
jgi:serine phosphatase RsbU (regulator of sigma subunit)/PAS domain-containing protein